LALDKAGYHVEGMFSRDLKKAGLVSKELSSAANVEEFSGVDEILSGIILIATQDSEIENVVKELSSKTIAENSFVFHTSGSLSSDVLTGLRAKDCFVGSIHPLVSVSNPILGVETFRDAYFCVEGDENAVTVANQIVETVGGKSFSIATANKILYHASAIMSAGHIVGLVDASMEMLKKCGLDANVSKEILIPLIKSTVKNIEKQENSEALTGTFARGDKETLEKHIETIRENTSPEILELYLNLGERSLKLAKEQGVGEEKISGMSKLISLAKNNSK